MACATDQVELRISVFTMASLVSANKAGLAGRWSKLDRMATKANSASSGQVSQSLRRDQDGATVSHGRVSRTMAHTTKVVASVPPTRWRRNPFHSMGNTSAGYFRYSTNRRLGRESYSLMNAGDAISSRARSATDRTTQYLLSTRQNRQVRCMASTGARSSSGKPSRLNWMMSTRTPWSSMSGQMPVAATRSHCHSISAMRESDSIGRPTRNNRPIGA